MMKHFVRRSLSASIAVLMTINFLSIPAFAADNTVGTDSSSSPTVITLDDSEDSSTIDTVIISGTYQQDEARKVLDMVNEFRTGDDAWYWNSDNTTKTKVENLNELVYDYELEKIAMQRAIEIALSYSHTRPNGKSCWSAYTEKNYNSPVGENITFLYAIAKTAFKAWKEDDKDYSGQGHRRMMLSSKATRMGCACVKYEGTCFWVQEFSASTQPLIEPTVANNSLTDMKVDILRSEIKSIKLDVDSTSLRVEKGESVSLPAVSASIILSSGAYKKKFCEVTSQGSWTSKDSSIASISDSTVKGVNYGSTEAVYSTLGSTVSVNLTVDCVHNYTTSVIKKPTCTESGTQKLTCSKCGDSYTEEIAKLDHSYQSTVTAPTCTQKGYTTYVCSLCGTSYKKEISATGHTYSTSITKKATCTEIGVKTYTCSKCGSSYKEEIPATGHTYTASVTKEATCIATGEKVYTCSQNDASYVEVIPVLEHDYQAVVTKPTETTGGYTTHTCSKCGDAYRDNKTAPLGTTSKVEKKTNKLTVKNKTTLTASTSKAQTLTLNVESLSGKVTYSNFKSNGSVKATCKDGKITFPKNFVGKVTVTAKAAASDNYLAASKTITITVNPTSTKLSSVSNAKGKKMTVKWKKNSLCSGYRIQYSTSKSFSSSKTKTVSKKSTTSTKISGLQKGKTYYVRIQTYKTVNGKKYYSGWSSASKVKISK
jgi:hypothetical protein